MGRPQGFRQTLFDRSRATSSPCPDWRSTSGRRRAVLAEGRVRMGHGRPPMKRSFAAMAQESSWTREPVAKFAGSQMRCQNLHAAMAYWAGYTHPKKRLVPHSTGAPDSFEGNQNDLCRKSLFRGRRACWKKKKPNGGTDIFQFPFLSFRPAGGFRFSLTPPQGLNA